MERDRRMRRAAIGFGMRVIAALVFGFYLGSFICRQQHVLAYEGEKKEEIVEIQEEGEIYLSYPIESLSIELYSVLEQEEYKIQEQSELTEELYSNLEYVEELLDEVTTTPDSEGLYADAVAILDYIREILERYPNDIAYIHEYYNEQKARVIALASENFDSQGQISEVEVPEENITVNADSESEVIQIRQTVEEGMISQTESTGMYKTQITVEGITLKFYEVDEEFILSHETATGDIILNDEEFIEFCKVIYKEAGNQGTVGQIIVGNIILNRMRLYGMSLHEVITQPRQFASIRGVSESQITDEIRESAIMALAADYTQGTLQEIAEVEGLSEDYYTPGYYFYNPYGCEEEALRNRKDVKVAFRYNEHICYGVK